MKLIKRGAEADLFQFKWHSMDAMMKIRKTKAYRHPVLDKKIRKQRTLHEAEIISLVKSFGISSPLIYFVDSSKNEIVMQYITGKTIHDLSPSQIIKACYTVGKIVGILHKNGIMHGDLTTSNFILSKNKIYVIDFGLSIKTEKLEDHAVDLRLIKEILNSAHAKIMEQAWKQFLQGYKSQVGKDYFLKILKLVTVIESRGRYATVV